MQNGYVESFNGKMRDELLNRTLFLQSRLSQESHCRMVEDDNTALPTSALASTPAAFAAKLTATGLHAALTDGSALRPVAHPAQTGIKLPEALSYWMKLPWQVSHDMNFSRVSLGHADSRHRSITEDGNEICDI